MNSSKIHFMLCVFLLLAFVPACGAVPEKSTIQLKPCTVGVYEAQCGRLRVYENRDAHRGRMINLNVVVIKASGDHPVPDPVFWLSGGPGGAATEDADTGMPFPFSLAESHDLVFVDQRGTGKSNQVLIPTDVPDLSDLTPEQTDAIDARIRPWIDKVLEEIDMDPRYYTTSVAMDDLDEVREALGYDKINLVGYSYGSTAAQCYLRQHEDHVRTVVLGGGSLLDIPIFERWAQNSQRALDAVFDQCLSETACQTNFPDVRTEFTGLMDRLKERPETVTFTNPANGQPASVTFTADYLAGEIRYMMKDVSNTSLLPLLIHRAYQDRDLQGFANFYASHGGPEWWGNQFMDHVIRCSEKWAAFDPGVVAELGSGSSFVGWDLYLSQTTTLSCKYTPAGITPEGQTAQPGSRVPILIWNGDRDPINPPENMVGSKALWPNSLAVIAPFVSHNWHDPTVSNCWFSLTNDFIQAGSAEGLQTTCLQDIQPPSLWIP
jgi:pimeloyl-ACP methyl ester carboxylesterase